MTHDERRLLCLLAREFADAAQEDRPMFAKELHKRVKRIQHQAAMDEKKRVESMIREATA